VQRYLKPSVGRACPLITGKRGREHLGGSIAKLLNLFYFFSTRSVICFLLPLIVSQEVTNEENILFPKSLGFMLSICTMGNKREV